MAVNLIALLTLGAPLTLEPTSDVWVYPHASDPSKDAYLRVWGSGGKSAPADLGEAEELSMSYLKWDLKSVPAGKKLKSAKLVLVHVANPGLTLEQAKAAPIEVRPIGAGFDEKTWSYDSLGTLLPKREKESVFGTGTLESTPKEQSVEITIDLLKGPGDFRRTLDSTMGSVGKELGLALTSVVDMASLGRSGMYKLYSKDSESKANHPRLVLEFED